MKLVIDTAEIAASVKRRLSGTRDYFATRKHFMERQAMIAKYKLAFAAGLAAYRQSFEPKDEPPIDR